jgi:preprotein translocase subunit SecY
MAFSDYIQAVPQLELIIFLVLVFLFISITAVVIVVILYRLRWNYNIVIAEEINGETRITGRDKARLIAFGDGGEEIFYLRKRKKFRGAYGKRIGHRQVLFVIGEDGLWYNSTLQSLNKKLLEVGLLPVDRDVRLSMTSLRKGLRDRLESKDWFSKYGQVLYFGLFVITLFLFAGMLWFVFDKLGEANASNLQVTQASKDAINSAEKVLSSIDNILSRIELNDQKSNIIGGSGLITENG